jgi:hypothetical protein
MTTLHGIEVTFSGTRQFQLKKIKNQRKIVIVKHRSYPMVIMSITVMVMVMMVTILLDHLILLLLLFFIYINTIF